MIITKLQGGLGNQMFQYAFGKALSLEHNCDLYVDTSILKESQKEVEGITPRQFELNVFNNNIKTADAHLIHDFQKEKLLKKGSPDPGLPHKKIYHETKSEPAEQFKSITPPVLLEGYWQSEKYFKPFAVQIKKEFQFTGTDGITGVELIKNMQSHNSVSIHIRRGDYVTNPVAAAVLSVLDKDYYLKAIDIINNKIKDPFYFFFSDDTEWVKKNFNEVKNHFVIENRAGKAAHEDMYLMSKCHNNIIANSSFSWWAAWLNDNPGKTVIAPAKWNKNQAYYNPHLIPAGWLTI